MYVCVSICCCGSSCANISVRLKYDACYEWHIGHYKTTVLASPINNPLANKQSKNCANRLTVLTQL